MPYTEKQIRNEALVELNNSKTGSLTTTQLIENLESRLHPTGKDATIAHARSDTYFSQKVRNLVSHRSQSTGLERRLLAQYEANNESWTITSKGRDRAKEYQARLL